MKVIRRTDMMEVLKAHEPEISSSKAVPPRASACGTEVHRVDIAVLECEVEGHLVHREAQPEVILDRSVQIRDHSVPVEKEIATGSESHERM